MKGKRQIKSLVAFFMATVFTVLTVLSVMPTVSASVGGGITPGTSGYVRTAGGNLVYVISAPEQLDINTTSQEDLDAALRRDIVCMSETMVRLYDATTTYNCHSFAWYSHNPYANKYWISKIDAFLNDPYTYDITENGEIPRVGDIAVYFRNGEPTHSALVEEVVNGVATRYISKFGIFGVYSHAPAAVVDKYYDEGPGGAEFINIRYYRYPVTHYCGSWESISTHKHERDCAYCAYAETEDHVKSNWVYAGVNVHARSCDVCGLIEQEQHAFGQNASLNDSFHKKTCAVSSCGASLTTAHTKMWSYTSAKHTVRCTHCNYIKTGSHQRKYQNISSTQHKVYCSESGCEWTMKQNHTVASWVSSGTAGHSGTCTVCKCQVTQAHVFTGTKCKICNYTGPGTAPDSIEFPEEIIN